MNHLNPFRFFGLSALTLCLAAVVGCSSEKKTEDSLAPEAAAESAPPAPGIENTPMSFDPMGSDSGKIAGLETVHFDYDKSSLGNEARKKIASNAEWMKKNTTAKVTIEGHCDNRGSNEYNIALGERRANAVKDYMVSLGVSASRLNTVSYGEDKPVAMGDSEADHKKNRRANFVPN